MRAGCGGLRGAGLTFDIQPLVGALPLRFGMARAEVVARLGKPDGTRYDWDGSGATDTWRETRIHVGYDREGDVAEVGFRPGGGVALSLRGERLWTATEQPDPNPALLRLELAPYAWLGKLIFPSLDIVTAGFHLGDASRYCLTVANDRWNDAVTDAYTPDLSRYRRP